MNEAYLAEFARRYLRRYQAVVKQAGLQPLVAAALWVPAASEPFVGVSQWFERQLDASVSAALDRLFEVASRQGVALPGHHGKCAEPVALSKALRWLQRSGHPAPVQAVAGGRSLAIQIALTPGSRNPSSPTFAFGSSFGRQKAACASCEMLLRAFGITAL